MGIIEELGKEMHEISSLLLDAITSVPYLLPRPGSPSFYDRSCRAREARGHGAPSHARGKKLSGFVRTFADKAASCDHIAHHEGSSQRTKISRTSNPPTKPGAYSSKTYID
jgi:hypothetical protein